ncbi:hypothetical protein PHMEG_00011501 [Phytophthora megakarya]|uniref:Uncharacterized protein n=1 Tax=Phytophthora megakarya TaxID=4795 RepID=A0A225WB37_9STRA|nr:hypothetical protein PHMEG_00011501 [Phytophthora megakarya]
MCFALPDVSSPCICLMVAWLSTCSLYGISTLSPISPSNSAIPSISAVTWDAATNSASIVDSTTLSCFLHSHPTTIPDTSSTPPVTDLRSTRSPRAIFLANLQSFTRGACVRLVTRCAAKAISGLVHRAIHNRLPTKDWKVCTVGLSGLPAPCFGRRSPSDSLSFSPPMGTRTADAEARPNLSSKSCMT